MSNLYTLASLEATADLDEKEVLLVRAVINGRTISDYCLHEQAQALASETVKAVSDELHVSRAYARELLASYVSDVAQQELGLHE